jgi:hypothetical protein
MDDPVARARGLVVERDHPGFDADDLLARDIARDGLPQGTTFVGMFR